MNINIIGGGSLCRLLIDIIDSQPEIVATGIFDDRFPDLEEVAGIKVIGKFADVSLEKSPKSCHRHWRTQNKKIHF